MAGIQPWKWQTPSQQNERQAVQFGEENNAVLDHMAQDDEAAAFTQFHMQSLQSLQEQSNLDDQGRRFSDVGSDWLEQKRREEEEKEREDAARVAQLASRRDAVKAQEGPTLTAETREAGKEFYQDLRENAIANYQSQIDEWKETATPEEIQAWEEFAHLEKQFIDEELQGYVYHDNENRPTELNAFSKYVLEGGLYKPTNFDAQIAPSFDVVKSQGMALGGPGGKGLQGAELVMFMTKFMADAGYAYGGGAQDFLGGSFLTTLTKGFPGLEFVLRTLSAYQESQVEPRAGMYTAGVPDMEHRGRRHGGLLGLFGVTWKEQWVESPPGSGEWVKRRERAWATSDREFMAAIDEETHEVFYNRDEFKTFVGWFAFLAAVEMISPGFGSLLSARERQAGLRDSFKNSLPDFRALELTLGPEEANRRLALAGIAWRESPEGIPMKKLYTEVLVSLDTWVSMVPAGGIAKIGAQNILEGVIRVGAREVVETGVRGTAARAAGATARKIVSIVDTGVGAVSNRYNFWRIGASELFQELQRMRRMPGLIVAREVAELEARMGKPAGRIGRGRVGTESGTRGIDVQQNIDLFELASNDWQELALVRPELFTDIVLDVDGKVARTLTIEDLASDSNKRIMRWWKNEKLPEVEKIKTHELLDIPLLEEPWMARYFYEYLEEDAKRGLSLHPGMKPSIIHAARGRRANMPNATLIENFNFAIAMDAAEAAIELEQRKFMQWVKEKWGFSPGDARMGDPTLLGPTGLGPQPGSRPPPKLVDPRMVDEIMDRLGREATEVLQRPEYMRIRPPPEYMRINRPGQMPERAAPLVRQTAPEAAESAAAAATPQSFREIVGAAERLRTELLGEGGGVVVADRPGIASEVFERQVLDTTPEELAAEIAEHPTYIENEAIAQALVEDQSLHTPFTSPTARVPTERNLAGARAAAEELNIADIKVDPERFQFKGAVDPETGADAGLVSALGEFDTISAGMVMVWEDVGGEKWIVNGHHRLQVARTTGHADDYIMARVFREADGFTERMVRAEAARQNIVDGTGTAIDAAKFIRESGEEIGPALESAGISPHLKLAQEGSALSRLDDTVFQRVVRGQLTQDRGVVIGRELGTPELRVHQRAAADAAVEGRGMRPDQLQAYIREQAHVAEGVDITAGGAQMSMFPDDPILESTIKEASHFRAGFIRRIRNNKSVQKVVLRNQGLIKGVIDRPATQQAASIAARAEELFEAMANTRGPIRTLINDSAAESLRLQNVGGAAGESLTQAKARSQVMKNATKKDGPLDNALAAQAEQFRTGVVAGAGAADPALVGRPGTVPESAGAADVPGAFGDAGAAGAAGDARTAAFEGLEPPAGAAPTPDAPRFDDPLTWEFPEGTGPGAAGAAGAAPEGPGAAAFGIEPPPGAAAPTGAGGSGAPTAAAADTPGAARAQAAEVVEDFGGAPRYDSEGNLDIPDLAAMGSAQQKEYAQALADRYRALLRELESLQKDFPGDKKLSELIKQQKRNDARYFARLYKTIAEADQEKIAERVRRRPDQSPFEGLQQHGSLESVQQSAEETLEFFWAQIGDHIGRLDRSAASYGDVAFRTERLRVRLAPAEEMASRVRSGSTDVSGLKTAEQLEREARLASSIPVEARETRRTLQLPAGDAPAAAADTPGAAAATAPGSPERARARAIELGHRTPEETNEALIDQLGLAPDYEGQKPYPQADDGLPPTAYLYTSGSTEITQARRWAKGKKTGPKYAAARKTVAMALEASGASTQPYQMAHFIHRLYLGELSEYPHFVTEWLGTHGAPPTAYLPTVREVEELFDILHRRPTNYPGDWVAGSVDGWPALDVEMAFDDRVKIARRASEIEQVAPPAAAAPEGATARVPREEAMRQSAEDVATEFFEDNIRDQFRHYEPGVQGAINDLAEGLRKGYGPDEISDLSGGQLLDPDGGHASAQALIDDYQGRVARLRSGVPLDEELKPGYMWRSDLEDELGRPIGAAPEQAAAPPPKPDPDLELRAASPEVQRYVARAEAAGRLTPPSTPEEIIDELMLMQGSEKAGRDVLGTAIERRHPQMLEDWLVNTGSVTEADAPGLSQSLLRRVERDVIPEGQTGLLDAPPRTPEDESERLIAEAEMTGGFAEGPDDFAPAPGSISAEVGPMIDRTPTAAAAAPPGGGAPPPRQPPPAPPGGPPAGAAPEPDNLGFERPLTSTPADEVQPPLPAAVEGAPSGLHRTGQPTLGYVTPPQEGIPFAAGSAEEAGDAMNRVRATRSAGGSLTDDIDPAFLQGTAFPPTAPPPGYVAMPIAGSGGKKEVFFLPREIRDAITQRLDPARQVAFVRGFDSLNSIYRVSVTQFFTDYHMRNMWSNYWRMMLDGVWNPIYGVKAAQVMRAARSGDASKRININGVIKDGAHKGLGGTDGKVTAAELFEVAENYGAFASLESRTGELAEIAGGALSGATMDIRAAGLASKAGIVSRFVSWVSGPGQYAETFMRLMHLLGRLDKGDDLLEAIAHVRKFQVDYTDLTQVERMMGRRVSFFYTYMRKSMALEVEQMIKGRRIGPLPIGPPIRNVQRARDWLQQELDPEGEELKEEVALWRRWVWDRLNIGVGRDDKGNPMILYATGLPIEFFNQWWAGTAKRTMQNTLNQWNPLVKMWIEMATNKSFFTKGDIDNPSHQNFLGHVDEITAGFPGLSQWLEVEKETIIDSETGEERTFYHANPSRVHVWMSLMPGMARMLRTADDVVNSDMGVGARLLNLFTGAKITSFDITSQVSQGYSSDHGAAFDTYNEDYEDLAERFLRNELTGMEFTKSRRELRDNLGEALSNADTRLREKQEDPYVDPEDVRRQAQLGALGAEAAELQRIENLDPASFMLDGLINWDAYWRTRDAMVEGLSPAQRTRWWKQEREYLDRLGPAAREVEEMYLDALEVTQAIAELPRYKLPDGRWLSDEIAARIDDANKEISTWARGRGPGSWNMSAIEYIRQGGPPGSSDSREFRQETVSLIRRSRYWYNPEITAIRQQNQVVLARVFGDSALGPLNTANEQLAPVGARDTFVGAGVSQ